MAYIGRFAPSPTGPLHFGSLLAAVASYLEAKTRQGQWLVRMEDLDKPREVAGAAADIMNTLEVFGFEWDGSVIYQSSRDEHYAMALATLKKKALVYPCTCTRKEVADAAVKTGIEGPIYPGTCLSQAIKNHHPTAWRVKTEDKKICFSDAIQGEVQQNLYHDIGDYVLKRADELFAYQLAVVVDDAKQGITHVVRGADLLTSTPRQLYLQHLLGYATPQYAHIPIAVNEKGQKLSKQTLAPSLNREASVKELWQALDFLNQGPPTILKQATLAQCWQWAMENWSLDKIPKVSSIQQ